MATLYHSSLSFSYASPMEECSFSSSHRHHCHMQAPTRKGTRVRTLPTHSTISRKQTHFGKFLCKLPDNTPAVVTQSSWNESILKSDIPVIVEFWASWCGPCRMVHPVIDEIAEEYAGRIKCFKLNTDYNPQVASDYDIHSIPTVLLFKNGEKRESMTGTMPKSVYVAAIERSLVPKDV